MVYPDIQRCREIILALWLAWLLYWIVSALYAKATRRRESPLSRVSYFVPLLAGAWLIGAPRARLGWLSTPLLSSTPQRWQLAVVLVALGLGFAVWARVHLGRNWSGSVTLKENHELIRSGPYKYVRHPIYTGLLLAFLGTALACGEARALLGLALIVLSFRRKLRIEEALMQEAFPGEYQRYAAQVPALIPLTTVRRSAPR